MTNLNKINGKQKDALAQYMVEHPNLAKNLLPNCSQGKATTKRLWDKLTLTLNSYGPPVKDVRSWRKVFADQKFNAKKKISFNKASKQKTGGGPYEEMVLTSVEEQIIEATGIAADVEGISVQTYGTPQFLNTSIIEENDLLNESTCSMEENGNIDRVDKNVKEKPIAYKIKDKVSTKLALVTSHVEHTEDYQRELLEKLENLSKMFADHTKQMEKYASEQNLKMHRLLVMKERSLKIKDEEHQINMAVKQLELEIKSMELNSLKQKRM